MLKVCHIGFILFFIFQALPLAYAGKLVVGGSGTDIATMKLMAEAFMKQHTDIKVIVLPSLGSGGGIKALAKGKIAIGLSSRPLNSKEKKYPVHAYQYAQTPMVLATHHSNQTRNISIKTFFDVMQGNKLYWPDGKLVRIVLRPPSDSDTLLLKSTYPQARQALDAAYKQRGIPVASTDQKAAHTLESIQGSLGTSTLAVILSEKRKIKALSLDTVAPTAANLENGTYKMSKNLYIVLPLSLDASTLKFVEFIQTKQGSQILLDTGHLPTSFKLSPQ